MKAPGSGTAASVVIPTFNRLAELERTLHSLEEQSAGAGAFEVVVADDGSSDGTREFLARHAGRTRRPFRFTSLESNGGPAKARNAALRLASGRIIIIIGDDIEVEPRFVQKHLEWHAGHPGELEALLGRVSWPEDLEATPFMKWLETGGRDFFFDYLDLQTGSLVPPTRFYTCNVSLKRSLLFRSTLFDEGFPYASHEDLELGWRLGEMGMRLHYEEGIAGLHRHRLTIAGTARRVYLMGYSARTYWGKVRDRSSPLRRAARAALPLACLLPGWRLVLGRLVRTSDDGDSRHARRWKALLVISYWVGLADATAGRDAALFMFPG